MTCFSLPMEIAMQDREPVSLLDRLTGGQGAQTPRTLVLAAHPEDVILAAGARLPSFGKARFIEVTTGEAAEPREYRQFGCESARDYALLRARELDAALDLAGLSLCQVINLNYRENEASFQLPELTRRVLDQIRAFEPEVLLTHAYEGGHPDHDACAFVAHAACEMLRKRGERAPELIEFAGYHNRSGLIVSGEFIPRVGLDECAFELAGAALELKNVLLSHFRTQKRALELLNPEREAWRLAPHYDFTREPHSGRLYYEMTSSGMTGLRWRSLARIGLAHLALQFRDQRKAPQEAGLQHEPALI